MMQDKDKDKDKDDQSSGISAVTSKLVQKSYHTRTLFTKEGEIVTLSEREERPGDFGFYKIWLNNLISITNHCSATTLKNFIYLIDLANAENKIIGTISQLAKKIKVSRQALSRSIKELIDLKAIVKINSGAFMISPDIIYRGYADKRTYAKYEFKNLQDLQDQDQDQEKEKSASQPPSLKVNN